MPGNSQAVIIVAAHKAYPMPSDPLYLPVQVGAAGREPLPGFIPDNTGAHISSLNPGFCELTGLYWAWKNLDAAYLGLAHYRRHFSLRRLGKDPFNDVLRQAELAPLLKKYSVFVPQKRRYYIETLYSHYAHTHYAAHLDMTRQIIRQSCPTYLSAFDRVAKRRWGYMFNMMILRRDLLDDYCGWLFAILFALRKQLDGPSLSAFQGRLYGRVSEILFNVWLEYQVMSGRIRASDIRELPCIHMEKVNWLKKGSAFLKAKFLHQRYEGSF